MAASESAEDASSRVKVTITFRDGTKDEMIFFEQDVEGVQNEVDDAFTQQSYILFHLRGETLVSYNIADIRKVEVQPHG